MVLHFHNLSADGIMISKSSCISWERSQLLGTCLSRLFLSPVKANTQVLKTVLTHYSNRVVCLCYCILFSPTNVPEVPLSH